MKPGVYILVGATSVGKTSFAIELAKRLKAEIISADSMQIYKGMDIGTAKPTASEMNGVPHHLIDICEPNADYSVSNFQTDACAILNDILRQNKTPIIAGGSGLYINSITYKLNFTQVPQNTELREMYNKSTSEELHLLLNKRDKCAAERIHPNNKKRIIRALEIAESIQFNNYNFETLNDDYDFHIIGLYENREVLYKSINERVDKMIQKGLIDEVEHLYQIYGNCKAFQAIGYKELIMYIDGEIELNEAIELIKRNTRHFAKRQLTWFKRDKRIDWAPAPKNDYDRAKLCDYILSTRFD